MVLGHNTSKASLEVKVIGKDKRDPVGFNFRKKAFVIFCGGTGRYRWAAKNGEHNDISTLGTSASEGRNYVTN